jgi:hypothetical protein
MFITVQQWFVPGKFVNLSNLPPVLSKISLVSQSILTNSAVASRCTTPLRILCDALTLEKPLPLARMVVEHFIVSSAIGNECLCRKRNAVVEPAYLLWRQCRLLPRLHGSFGIFGGFFPLSKCASLVQKCDTLRQCIC